MDSRILILDQERIDRKLQRMAFEIWERNNNEKQITLIGIEGAGVSVANNLAARLRSISPLDVHVLVLSINKKKPLSQDITLGESIDGRSVVLVDDVANSGKTLLYALKPVLNFETKQVIIAVLVDRKHKSFPVSPDIVGHSVSTTLQEHIEVVCSGDLVTGAYLL
ncbi:MAG: phosphoribosyltransferase [Sphingobacteriales bacterium]|nr:MAG: phosphoribosyltransferase [Sphingobacteriales bacterium]